MRRGAYVGVIVSILAFAAAVAPAAANASPGWTAPANFSLPSGALPGSLQIAYQSGGTATVAYIQLVSTTLPYQTVLHVGVIAPGSGYQEQLRIASTSTSLPLNIALAEAPDGAAVVEWAALQGSNITTSPLAYLASYRAAGASTWGAPTTIATDSTQVSGISYRLVPAISADGTAAAGVQHDDPTIGAGGYRDDVAVVPSGGAWGAATQISPTSTDSPGLALAFDGSGDLTAAFQVTMGNGRHYLADTRRPASSGVWGSLESLTNSGDATSDAGSPALAVAADGDAVVAFQYVHHAAPNTLDTTVATRHGAAGTWTAPLDVTPGGASSGPLAVGVSATGQAYIEYQLQASSSTGDCVGIVRLAIGSASPQTDCLVTNLDSYRGGLALLGNDAYFAWTGNVPGDNSGPYAIQASRWVDGAAQPDAATDLDSPGSNSLQALVPDQDGSIAAFWSNSSTNMRAAAYDAGGPNLSSATVPASAVTGQAVAMSASFVDLWSGVSGQASWNFGDGSTATGASVSHTYRTAGTYTVTVSAVDGLGNQTTSTYSITVSAAPTLDGVGESARTWRESGKTLRGARKQPPAGTTFRFTLNMQAAVTLTFSQNVPGRRVGDSCRRQTRRNKHKRPCRLTSVVGTIALTGKAGLNKLAFTGTLPNGHKLRTGSYQVVIVASNSAGRASSKPLRFKIV